MFFWCPCMVINVVSVQYNGGFLPDIILLTQGYYHRGTRLNDMKRFFICSLWSQQQQRQRSRNNACKHVQPSMINVRVRPKGTQSSMYYLVLLLIVKVCTSTFVANVYVGYHHPRAYCTTSATVYINSLLQLLCVCVCFLPIHSGHQVRWTYQPGSHRRKVTQDFSSTFFLRCVP